MDDLQKIELGAKGTMKQNIVNSKKPSKRFYKSRIFKIIVSFFIFAVVFAVVLLFAVALPAQKTYKSALKTQAQAQITWQVLKQQNVELASTELEKTRQYLKETEKELKKMSYLKSIPLASGYYNDAEHLVNAGFRGMDAAKTLIDSIKPYADVLGLKGQGSFTMGSAEQRIQVAVRTMGKITPRIDEIAKDLNAARKEIDMVDPKRYPSFFQGDKIKTQLTKLQTLTDQGVAFVDQARPLIKVLPSLMGESEEKKYLVIFQNDKELRPTGGFITAYAVFRVDKGIIHVDRSDDIYTLDNSIYGKPQAPEPILKYLAKVPLLNLRDSNLSPDFITSMDTFNSLYKKSGGYMEVDGIIALDTHVLVSTIKILDDEVYAAGIKFTSQTDKRCDCPSVIYTLEDTISRPVNYVKSGRKDLLGVLMYAIMEKALKSSPKIYWGPLVQDFITKTNEKHILFYLYDRDAQKGIEALNAAGRMKKVDGDYFHLNEANFAGGKANLFVKEAVEQNYEVDTKGVITKHITVAYKNAHPPSDCNLERGGLCLNAPYRDWFRVYVPKGSKLTASSGSEVKMTSYEELEKTVFEGFLSVRPLGKAQLTFSYQLPFKLKNGSPLPLTIQKQPGTDNNSYTIKVKGKQIEEFPLLIDKKITIQL